MGCWECPLCCRKQFPNKLTLKYHLLSTILISCPNCCKNFDGILELANHLDGECYDEKLQNENNIAGATGDGKSSEALVPQNTLSQNEDSSSDAVVASAGVETLQQWQESDKGKDDGDYFCIACNCQIKGVVEHIQEFHSEEPQVYIQEEDVDCEMQVNEEADGEVPVDVDEDDVDSETPVDADQDHVDTEMPVNVDENHADIQVPVSVSSALSDDEDLRKCSHIDSGTEGKENCSSSPIKLGLENEENLPCIKQAVRVLADQLEHSSNQTEPSQKIIYSKTDGREQQAKSDIEGLENRSLYRTGTVHKTDNGCIKESPTVGKSLETHSTNGSVKPKISSLALTNNAESKLMCTGSVEKIGHGTLYKKNALLLDDTTSHENVGSQIPSKSSDLSISSENVNKQKGRQSKKKPELKIVEQSDLVDKSGMHYVRNVVKIEKFWDSKSTASWNRVASVQSELLKGNETSRQKLESLKGTTSATEDSEHQYALQTPGTMYEDGTDPEESADSNLRSPPKKRSKQMSRRRGDGSEIKTKCIKYPVVLPDPVECEDGNLMCNSCCGQFANPDEYQSHTCKRKGRSYLAPSTCAVCQVVCISPCDLEMHQHLHRLDVARAERTTKKQRICEVCNMYSYSPVRFKTHFNLHILEKKVEDEKKPGLSQLLGILKCSKCNAVFRENEELIEHWQTHKVGVPTKLECQKTPTDVLEEGNCREYFFCGICGKKVPEGGRTAHEELHRGKKVLACPICNKPFYNNCQTDLEFHMVVHNTDNKHPCFYCKQKFENVFLLRKHVTETHPMLNRPYACSFCGRRFFKVSEKNKHEKIHTGEKKYPCEVCGASFRSAYCRRIHMRIHTGMRPHCCSECGKTFRTQPALTHHVRLHSDIRAFTCPHCPKAFKSPVHLGNHVRQHEKRFTCQTCGRRFADLFSMRSHLKAHTLGTLIATCLICGASYGREYAVQEHMKAEHSNMKVSSTVAKSPVKTETKPRKARPKKSSTVQKAIDSLLGLE